MHYKKGDIVLINFPFTDLARVKKRPVLVVKDENSYGDFVCFQVTSQKHQSETLEIIVSAYKEEVLKFTSFVKYDKCFTLNNEIVDKKLTAVGDAFLLDVKEYFCSQL